MSQQSITSSASGMLEELKNFIATCKGLKAGYTGNGLVITQTIDSKSISIDLNQMEQILPRVDQEGKSFLQINLTQSKKIILTEQLVGFKPLPITGLDLKQLPRVVTTPDLISVLEAYEDVVAESLPTSSEPQKLKLAFNSIIKGGEDVGFDLSNEKLWLLRLMASTVTVSA